MKRIFFFDSHPPFGKQLIAAAAYFAEFDGKILKCLFLILFVFTYINIFVEALE